MEKENTDNKNMESGSVPENPPEITPEQDMVSVSMGRIFIRTVLELAVVAAVVIAINTLLVINTKVASGSMETEVMTGDRAVGWRLAYSFGDSPERGDIIFFGKEDLSSKIYIKRIIGLPGETVEIKDGCVYIDGVLLKEEYLTYEPDYDEDYTFVVPDGCYFVMGDNRDSSYDSRFWDDPYVEEDEILAKAVFVYWPISSFGTL